MVEKLTIQQMFEEMDIALADEIKKQGSKLSKRVAVKGKPSGEQNGLYLYEFSLESPWTPQDDAPISIRISSSSPVNGTIIKATGTNITVSFEKPLTQEELQKLDIYSDPTELTKRLRTALKNAKDGKQQLASKSFGLIPFQKGKRAENNTISCFLSEDETQKAAALMALGSEVTYIIGPPGTGKTYTLAAIAYASISEGRSVLIAAHTNIAADNAIKSLVENSDKHNFALNEGQAVRFGPAKALEGELYKKVCISAIIKNRTNALSNRKGEIELLIKQINEVKAVWQQEQAHFPWETQLALLLEKRTNYQNTLNPLQLREQQRIAEIDKRIQYFEQQLRIFQQQIEQTKKDLAKSLYEQVNLKSSRTRHLSDSNILEASLTEAQQMNGIKRFFKGVNVDNIANQFAQAKQQVWQDDQHLNALQTYINSLHAKQNSTEKLTNQCNHEYNAVKSQKMLPTSDAQQVVQLTAELQHLEAQISQGNALQAQQLRQREAQEQLYKNEVAKLEEERSTIDKQLQDMEKKIVAEAQLVATTLSKVYMNSNLSERQFDIVIIDEVSMAPLPATYITACHADRSVIALGDPQQLPPIVQATTKMASEWLGKDLFARNDIDLENAASSNYGNSAILKNQSRMHPEISAIARKHVYKNELHDSKRVLEREPTYSQVTPLKEKYLLLCDTSDASPIATSPENVSRINIYHALCSMAIARQVIDTLPISETTSGDTRRIGIITPYRKQAELLQKLVIDSHLEDIIHAGTVHKFQGIEYDVIIFDTVESIPLKPAEDFIKGGYRSKAMRLINVAITRAKHKLIIVANRSYVHANFAENDTLRLAIEDAAKNATIKSKDILNIPFAPLSDAFQRLQVKSIDKVSEIAKSLSVDEFFRNFRMLNEQNFYDAFIKDVQDAKKEIVIVSPYLAPHRTKFLLPSLAEKRKNGVKILVITKPINEYNIEGKTEALALLKDIGVDIQQREYIHIKWAIIDKTITYYGSLNILSHSKSIESMMRLKSESFAGTIENAEGLADARKIPQKLERPVERRNDDIVVYLKELPKLKCACGHDMLAKSSINGFFYSCVNYRKCDPKDKSKNITEEHLKSISRLTNVHCTNCNSDTAMTIQINRRDFRLECSNPSCGCSRNIVIEKN